MTVAFCHKMCFLGLLSKLRKIKNDTMYLFLCHMSLTDVFTFIFEETSDLKLKGLVTWLKISLVLKDKLYKKS